MKRWILLAALLLGAGALRADMTFNFGVGVDAGHRDFYLGLSDYYGVPPEDVSSVVTLGIRDEEVPVVFFLAQQGGVHPAIVARWRRQGLSYLAITRRLGMDPSVFYSQDVFQSRLTGPYARLWRFYHAPRSRWTRLALTNADIINLVNLRFVNEHQGMAPEDLARERGRGRRFYQIWGQAYRSHAQDEGEDQEQDSRWNRWQSTDRWQNRQQEQRTWNPGDKGYWQNRQNDNSNRNSDADSRWNRNSGVNQNRNGWDNDRNRQAVSVDGPGNNRWNRNGGNNNQGGQNNQGSNAGNNNVNNGNTNSGGNGNLGGQNNQGSNAGNNGNVNSGGNAGSNGNHATPVPTQVPTAAPTSGAGSGHRDNGVGNGGYDNGNGNSNNQDNNGGYYQGGSRDNTNSQGNGNGNNGNGGWNSDNNGNGQGNGNGNGRWGR